MFVCKEEEDDIRIEKTVVGGKVVTATSYTNPLALMGPRKSSILRSNPFKSNFLNQMTSKQIENLKDKEAAKTERANK